LTPDRSPRSLLQAFFSVRSERQLMEQIDYNLLFRWFVGLSIDDEVWDATVFTKNRNRLLEAEVAQEFLSALLSLPKVRHLLSRACPRAGQRPDPGDVAGFVGALRAEKVTPHITIDGHVRVSGKPRKTAIDGRTTRHPGYAVSQRKRKRIEEIFGWTKAPGGVAQVKVRGLAKVKAAFTFAVAAYNLLRIPKLLLPAAA
jgi:IS5 family transposase